MDRRTVSASCFLPSSFFLFSFFLLSFFLLPSFFLLLPLTYFTSDRQTDRTKRSDIIVCVSLSRAFGIRFLLFRYFQRDAGVFFGSGRGGWSRSCRWRWRWRLCGFSHLFVQFFDVVCFGLGMVWEQCCLMMTKYDEESNFFFSCVFSKNGTRANGVGCMLTMLTCWRLYRVPSVHHPGSPGHTLRESGKVR